MNSRSTAGHENKAKVSAAASYSRLLVTYYVPAPMCLLWSICVQFRFGDLDRRSWNRELMATCEGHGLGHTLRSSHT